MLLTFPPHANIPRQVCVACSGGADSMALLHFLQMGRKKIKVIHVNHGTPEDNIFQKFVEDYCRIQNLEISTFRLTEELPDGESKEFFWANQRYGFFNLMSDTVVTGSHLDDAVETWLMSCLMGQPKIPEWRCGNVFRPLLLTKKSDLYRYCREKNVPFVEDESNTDTAYLRNNIRHNLVEPALKINPGLYTVISKKLKGSWSNRRG